MLTSLDLARKKFAQMTSPCFLRRFPGQYSGVYLQKPTRVLTRMHTEPQKMDPVKMYHIA
jgi:hypothetical protein